MTKWPRYLEILLAVWLTVSLPVFGVAFAEGQGGVVAPLVAPLVAIVLIVLAILSMRNPDKRYHLWGLLPALLLIVTGFAYPSPPPPLPLQNLIVSGLLWMLLAILPTRPARPPEGWHPYLKGDGGANKAD